VSGTAVRARTWSRVGVGLSVGLIVFGVVDAAVSHHSPAAGPAPASIPLEPQPDARVGVTVAPARDLAARQVATQFVTAIDTTDPSHPTGDTATEMTLAPQLVPSRVPWPVAWINEDRRTTVALDPPGQLLAESGGQVAVIVTGTITVISDSGSPLQVPLTERVTLGLSPDRPGAGGRAAGGQRGGSWVVTGVEAGS